MPISSTLDGKKRLVYVSHKETFRNSRIAIVVTLGSRGARNPPLPDMRAARPELPMAVELFRTYREAERWIAQGD